MEKAKRDLKETYDKYLKEGLSKEEALSKAILEVREKHEEEKFKRALEEFLKEIVHSYKFENLAEADPVMALVEFAYAEWEMLWPKVKNFFEGR